MFILTKKLCRLSNQLCLRYLKNKKKKRKAEERNFYVNTQLIILKLIFFDFEIF